MSVTARYLHDFTPCDNCIDKGNKLCPSCIINRSAITRLRAELWSLRQTLLGHLNALHDATARAADYCELRVIFRCACGTEIHPARSKFCGGCGRALPLDDENTGESDG